MRRRLQKMVSASSSIASGDATYASRRRPSIGAVFVILPQAPVHGRIIVPSIAVASRLPICRSGEQFVKKT
jgi:hypothetical protein